PSAVIAAGVPLWVTSDTPVPVNSALNGLLVAAAIQRRAAGPADSCSAAEIRLVPMRKSANPPRMARSIAGREFLSRYVAVYSTPNGSMSWDRDRRVVV